MNIEITGLLITLVSFVVSGMTSFMLYVLIAVQRFIRLEADVNTVMKFYINLQDRMVDLIIKMETPELDRLLLRFKRGDILEEREWRDLHEAIEQQHVQAIRNERSLNEEPTKTVSMAIFLAAIEARHEAQIKKSAPSSSWWAWFKDLIKKSI